MDFVLLNVLNIYYKNKEENRLKKVGLMTLPPNSVANY